MFLNYVIETFQKQLEGLKCIEEHCKESYLKDLQDKELLFKIETATVKIKIFNISAGKKGNAPKAHTLSAETKLVNHSKPNI